ncbi:response regulator [Hoeflea sp. AS60]|uniref:response regulator n=1 Tax=Hoeflea sp. AS60 TaxID=3135780 RepID=UPI00316D76F1
MNPSQHNEAEPDFAEPTKGPPKILIADDDPGVVRVLSARCKRMGAEVITASNGLLAILKAKQDFPDFVIVDINMPEIDGFNVCDWLLDPGRPRLNVIVLTGNQDQETLERCDALGTYHVLKSSQAWETIGSILSRELGIKAPEYDTRAQQIEKSLEKKTTGVPSDGPRILLVEDDKDMLRFLEPRLRKLGATVFTAENAVDGYRMASRELPNVIISDYLMPEGGGHYMLWRLRANKRTAGIPVLVVTGDTSVGKKTTLRDDDLFGFGGPTKIFYKPLFMDDLIEEVKKHLSAHSGMAKTAAS